MRFCPRFVRCATAALALLVMGFVATAPRATAQTYTWTKLTGGNGSGSWADADNWSPATVPNAVDITANLSTLNITVQSTITLDGSYTIGTLIIGDATTPNTNWTISKGSSGTLTLQTTSGSPTINVTNQTTTISASLAGTQGFNKTGAGTLILSGSNSGLSGSVTSSNGTLQFTSANSLGGITSLTATSATAFIGATSEAGGTDLATFWTLVSADKANYQGIIGLNANVATALDLTGFHATATLGASTSATLSGTITPQGSDYRFVSFGSAVLTISSALTGNRNLLVSGTGTTTLSGTNSYTGTTTVTGGLLSVSSLAGLGSTSSLELSGGSILQTTGTFAIAIPLTLGTGGGKIDVSGANTTTLNSNITGAFPFTKSGTGTLLLNGSSQSTGLSITGTLRASSLASLGTGTITAVDVGTFNFLSDEDVDFGRDLATNGPATLDITPEPLTPGITNKTYTFNQMFSNSTGASLRVSGTSGYNVHVKSVVTGGGAIMNTNNSNGELRIDALTMSKNLRSVTFNGSGTTIMSGNMNDEVVTATGGNPIIKSGTGTLILKGYSSFGGNVTISQGTVIVEKDDLARAATTTNTGSASDINAANDTITLKPGSGFSVGDPIAFGTGITGVTQGRIYYIKTMTGNTITLDTRADLAGGTVDIIGTGTGNYGVFYPGSLAANASSSLILGDSSSGSNPIRFLTGDETTVNRNISVANNGSGTTIGGNSANASTFGGTLTLAKTVTLSQVAGGTAAFTGDITGAFGVTISGGGTVIFGGTAKSYTGTTHVAAGTTLRVNGSTTSTSLMTVEGALGGLGTIAGSVTVASDGILSPGDDAVGTLSIAGAFALNGVYTYEAGDLLAIGTSGTLTLGTGSELHASGLDGSSSYTIATFPADGLTGTFSIVNAPGYAVSYNSGSIVLSPVPEPASVLALVAAVGTVLRLRRRRPTAYHIPSGQ